LPRALINEKTFSRESFPVQIQPIKKLILPAGQAFGPLAGLGPLEYASHGAMRLVLGARIDLPLAMPAPFLWEMQLTSPEDLPEVQVTLEGEDASVTFLCRPGQRTEVMGAVHPRPGLEIRAMSFTFGPEGVPGKIWFLGLSLLPLGGWIQP
jgi:hypothetical protein